MMRRVVFAAMLLLVCPLVLAQGFHHHAPSAPAPGDDKRVSPCVKILNEGVPPPDVQKIDWNVTGNASAKADFSRGMTEYYGFNYEEAMLYFRKAKKEDPDMAMAAWGLALATGPNINLGMDDKCRALAVQESSLAVKLASQQKGITQIERGLINALPLRYSGLLTETVAYSVAMSAVWKQATNQQRAAMLQKPDAIPLADANANVANVGALYAESLVEKRPWGLFDAAYRPALDTPLIYEVLDLAMKAQPCVIHDGKVNESCAIGANHYWIHTAESSKNPGEARHSADVLLLAVPGSGHLVHMPSHIYLLQGEYKLGMDGNGAAVRIDNDQYAYYCRGNYNDYSSNSCCPQLYYGHYLSHNHFFRAVSAAFLGQSKEAAASACATRDHAQRFVANEPGLQRYMTAPLQVWVMNRNWDAILASTEPPADCWMSPFPANGCHILRAVWYWARGMAHAERGDLMAASCDYNKMTFETSQIAPPAPTGWGNNTAAAVLAIPQSILQARYTWAGGECKACLAASCKPVDPCQPIDPLSTPGSGCDVSKCSTDECRKATVDQAIEHLKLAVTHEDALVYDEPPQWFPPAREALGGAYLRDVQMQWPQGVDSLDRFNRAVAAKIAFQEAICRNPKSGRALYGLMRSYEYFGHDPVHGSVDFGPDAVCERKDVQLPTPATVKQEFCAAWKDADYSMTDTDLWPAIPGTKPFDPGSNSYCSQQKPAAPNHDPCPAPVAPSEKVCPPST